MHTDERDTIGIVWLDEEQPRPAQVVARPQCSHDAHPEGASRGINRTSMSEPETRQFQPRPDHGINYISLRDFSERVEGL